METIHVSEIQSGDTVAFDEYEPVWVTAVKLKKDSYGYDLLYTPDGDEPRWRGFDDTDRVLRR